MHDATAAINFYAHALSTVRPSSGLSSVNVRTLSLSAAHGQLTVFSRAFTISILFLVPAAATASSSRCTRVCVDAAPAVLFSYRTLSVGQPAATEVSVTREPCRTRWR